MFCRSLYTLHFPYVRLRINIGITQFKKLPLEMLSFDLTRGIQKLSIFQCLKLPSKTQPAKVKLENCKKDTEEKENTATENNDLSNKLVHWVMQNNISHVSFSQLLKILHKEGLKNLPKNSKVLLQAKEGELEVHPLPPGVYYHFGLEKNLKMLVEHLLLKKYNIGQTINLSIFMDELLLSMINKDCLWVILGSIVEFNKIVFGVGAYRGPGKPNDSNSFLSEFVKEVDELCRKGLVVNQTNYRVAIKRVICDAPTKAFILNVPSHAGYSSCTKCWVVGEHVNKVYFPGESKLKTDEDYQNPTMYKGKATELLKISNFGVVSNIPLDYMHLVCSGIVRKLLTNFLDKVCVKTVSKKIDKIEGLYEFSPKSLAVLSGWDAKDFRTFLLYHGPAVLHGVLSQNQYDNFLHLHAACRLLCTGHSPENAELGKTLLSTFIEQFKGLYGIEGMSHNVHGLNHLVDDYLVHGTLDNFSSFSYEKFLSKLRRSMKKSKKKTVPQLILKESLVRVFTRSLAKLTKQKFKVFKEEKVNSSYSKFAYLYLSGMRISCARGDNYVLLKDNKIVQVVEISKKDKGLFVSGKEFTSATGFYEKPLDSRRVNVFQVGSLSSVVQTWSVLMIDTKCVRILLDKNKSVMIGLLNES